MPCACPKMEQYMAEFIFVVFILILLIMGYGVFFLLPRRHDYIKRQQEQQHLVQSLSVGDEVVTGGGLIGTVRQLDIESGVAHIEIARGLQVRVVTAAILDVYNPETKTQKSPVQREVQTETE
jgi:preprotein translocase subunit YajC